MNGVVLAAGEWTRRGPLTDEQSKALVTVAGQPLLSHGFDALLSVGVSQLVVVGYRGDDIVDRYGDSYRETDTAARTSAPPPWTTSGSAATAPRRSNSTDGVTPSTNRPTGNGSQRNWDAERRRYLAVASRSSGSSPGSPSRS
ncbi:MULTISPECIES: NTP transferase domain-containing protein [Haloarcula]|uniref:NTP transferase domain-containing protein n=1 Tax=Haloarcula TaxID=2237 RepID=UPI0023E80A15|nr:NTP transferase domain-containing protein [Halomicroarcula sp. SHR3]